MSQLQSVPMIEVETVPETEGAVPPVMFNAGEDAEAQAHQIQAMSEGVVHGDTVECLGGHYRVADKVGLMPLLKFAHTASMDVDANDMEGLVAIYDMLRDCLHEDDWKRFERDMTVKKAEADEMMTVVQQAIEVINARPTRQPSGSSSGPPTTGAPSTATSSSPPAPRARPGMDDTLVPVGRLAEAL
ncbi:hypothetical protein [Actinomadura litoris]|uniref:Uncharacterized protein n=1 Tax=Actinomadura litoris TaxID=2678616 RepID=A0A7K1LAD9_9ACTN|nr:hypothetical protein [Actinomadura litoris]MUN41401.1 hypothetical protein [Actinomadura litoris]